MFYLRPDVLTSERVDVTLRHFESAVTGVAGQLAEFESFAVSTLTKTSQCWCLLKTQVFAGVTICTVALIAGVFAGDFTAVSRQIGIARLPRQTDKPSQHGR